MACGLVPHNRKRHGRIGGRFGEVGGTHGISIHSAVGKRRDVDIGRGVLGKGKAGRLPYRDLDDTGRSNVRQNNRLRVLQRNEFLCHMHLLMPQRTTGAPILYACLSIIPRRTTATRPIPANTPVGCKPRNRMETNPPARRVYRVL